MKADPDRKAELERRLSELDRQIERTQTAIAKARGNATDEIVAPELSALKSERTSLSREIEALDSHGDAV